MYSKEKENDLRYYIRVGQLTAHEPHAVISLISCGSCIHLHKCIYYICLLHLTSERKVRGDAHVSHEFDVARCGITIENAVLSLALVSHPCTTSIKKY